jgi:hypothetical protein
MLLRWQRERFLIVVRMYTTGIINIAVKQFL